MQLLTNKTIERLKYDLVREKLIELDDLINIEDIATKNNTNLAVELAKNGIISEEVLLKFIEQKLHIPFVDLNNYEPDLNCLKYISSKDAKKYNILPLFKIEDVLTVAMSDPLDLFVINSLFKYSDINIEPVICSETLLKEKIESLYFNDTKKDVILWQDMLFQNNITDDFLKKIITNIIKDAINSKVKNILLEKKNTDEFNVIFDNELKGYIPSILISRFIFELKVFANLNPDLYTIPQFARLNFDKNFVTVSFFPLSSGERISIRIYGEARKFEESDLFTQDLQEKLERPSFIAIRNSDEICYSLLSYLSKKYNILSIENKIKYELPNVNQLEINKNVGLYLDEILNNLDFQGFNAIFIEKAYTEEQLEKLKLLSKDIPVIVKINDKQNTDAFDYVIKD